MISARKTFLNGPIPGSKTLFKRLTSPIPPIEPDYNSGCKENEIFCSGFRLVSEMPFKQETFPLGKYDPRSSTFLWKQPDQVMRGKVAILAAGTSDLPAAAEAAMTLDACNINAELIVDVGVAAIHRLFKVLDKLTDADAVIAAAGMEGALPSVTAGLIKAPVIALPTSVGYGANLQGLTPLMAMLNSCASGVTVVNIDNGFGAACAAARIVNCKYSTGQTSLN